MSEVLLIRLGGRATELISWMVWSDAEQEIIASGELNDAGELHMLTDHGSNREVKVLVPGSEVTLKTVTLPGKFSRQLQAALPFMLEDDLTQDVDKLFFAVGDKGVVDGKHTIDVAIVDRQLMVGWQSWLAEAQLQATTFLPDALCLPLYEHGCSGIELNNQWLVRSGKWQSSSIDSPWFADYLNFSAFQFDLTKEEDSEQHYTFVTHSPCLVSADNLTIEEQTPELPLKLLMSNIKAGGFNLLQGDFAFKKEGSKFWKTWQTAIVIAGLAIVMQIAYRGGMAWHYGSELENEKQVLTDMYRKAFPGKKTRAILIAGELRRKVKALDGGKGGNAGFMAMLSQLSGLLAKSDGFVPNTLKYDAKRNEIRMDATANSFQEFEKFKTEAEKLGFTVQQGSLSNNGDKVDGSISVRRGG